MTLRVEMFRSMGTVGADEAGWQTAAHDWFAARVGHPDYGLFVVEADGEVVSCAIGSVRDSAPAPGSPNGRDVLISNVCTQPSQRGRGYGRAAFGAAMAWARTTGAGRAELMATEGGRGLYERAGFAVTRWPAMRAPLEIGAPGRGRS